MAQRLQEIEVFVRYLVIEVEAAEAIGMTGPQAIADHFNAKGITTRKGRRDCRQIPHQPWRQTLSFGWKSGVRSEAERQS